MLLSCRTIVKAYVGMYRCIGMCHINVAIGWARSHNIPRHKDRGGSRASWREASLQPSLSF